MIRAGIIGGAGYTAGELIRLLVNHPQVRLAFVHSTSNAGNRIADVHGGLATPNCASPTPATSRRSTSCSSVRRTARAANGSKRTTFPPA